MWLIVIYCISLLVCFTFGQELSKNKTEHVVLIYGLLILGMIPIVNTCMGIIFIWVIGSNNYYDKE